MKNYLLYFILLGQIIACDQPKTEKNMTASSFAVPDSVIVPLDEAYRMVANYAPKAGFVERDGQLLPDSRAIWFPIEMLRLLVDQIEDEGGDGIRFYLSTYDSDYTDAPEGTYIPPERYWGYNTLLLVSTRDSMANGQHYHRDYFDSSIQGSRERQAGFIVTSRVRNRGNVCYPDCQDNPTLLGRN